MRVSPRRRFASLDAIVVLLALTILGAAFIPNVYRAVQFSHVKRTMADMHTVGVALEERAAATRSFTLGPRRPVARGTFHHVPWSEVERALVPAYRKTLPRIDAWGEPIRVYVGGYDAQGRARSYLIRSLGKDRRADMSVYRYDRSPTVNADIVFVNGNFIYHLEGL